MKAAALCGGDYDFDQYGVSKAFEMSRRSGSHPNIPTGKNIYPPGGGCQSDSLRDKWALLCSACILIEHGKIKELGSVGAKITFELC